MDNAVENEPSEVKPIHDENIQYNPNRKGVLVQISDDTPNTKTGTLENQKEKANNPKRTNIGLPPRIQEGSELENHHSSKSNLFNVNMTGKNNIYDMVKGSKLYNKFIEAEKSNSNKPGLQKFKQFQHISKNNENVTKSVQLSNKDENTFEEKANANANANENLKFQNKSKQGSNKFAQGNIQTQNEKDTFYDKDKNNPKLSESEIEKVKEKEKEKKPSKKKGKGLVKDYTNPDIINNLKNEIQVTNSNALENNRNFIEVRVPSNKKNNFEKQINNEPLINSEPESNDSTNHNLVHNQSRGKNVEPNSNHMNEPISNKDKEQFNQKSLFESSNSKLQKDNFENYPHESISSPPYPELQGYSESIFPPNKFAMNNPSEFQYPYPQYGIHPSMIPYYPRPMSAQYIGMPFMRPDMSMVQNSAYFPQIPDNKSVENIKIEDLRKELEQSKIEINKLRENKEVQKIEITNENPFNDLNLQVQKLKEENNYLRKLIEDENMDSKNSKKEINNNKNELVDKEKDELFRKVHELENQLENLKTKQREDSVIYIQKDANFAALQAQVEDLKKANINLTSEIEVFKNENNIKNGKNEANQAIIEQLNQEIFNLKLRNSEGERKLMEEMSKSSKMISEITKLQSQLQALQLNLSASQESYKGLQQQYNQMLIYKTNLSQSLSNNISNNFAGNHDMNLGLINFQNPQSIIPNNYNMDYSTNYGMNNSYAPENNNNSLYEKVQYPKERETLNNMNTLTQEKNNFNNESSFDRISDKRGKKNQYSDNLPSIKPDSKRIEIAAVNIFGQVNYRPDNSGNSNQETVKNVSPPSTTKTQRGVKNNEFATLEYQEKYDEKVQQLNSIEKKLMAMQIKKSQLQAELDKLPETKFKSNEQKRRRAELESELSIANGNIMALKQRIKSLKP